MKRLIVLVLIAAAAMSSKAMDVLTVSKGALALQGSYCAIEGGFTYRYFDNDDGTITLSPYDRNGMYVGAGISPSPIGDFTLPEVIDGKRVVAIGSYFFNSSYGMTSLVLPATVTNISAYAISGVSTLTNITVAAENLAYKSVDGILYTKDGKTLVACPKGKGGNIVVASGTERIAANAFYNNNQLVSVELPEGLTAIESYAFYSCVNYINSFTSVTIPETVEDIGEYAFAGCIHLAKVTFAGAEDDINIADTAFFSTPYDAGKPFSLIIKSQYIYIDNQYRQYPTLIGFHGQPPESLVLSDYLGGQPLTVIDYNALSAWKMNSMLSVTNVVVSEGVLVLGSYAFAGDAKLESVYLPASLRYINYGAFQSCTSLREIRIPAGVTSIANDVFYGCVNLTVHAPSTVEGLFSVPDGCAIEYYEIPEYTVRLDANGGTVDGESVKELKVLEGHEAGLSAPVLDGYVFLGWFTATDGGEKVAADTSVTSDMTLYAHWAESPFSAMSAEYPWTVDGDGNWKSGTLPSGVYAPSWAEISVEGPCCVSFQWKRPQNAYFYVYVDGEYYYANYDVNYYDGEWADCSVETLISGSHTIQFLFYWYGGYYGEQSAFGLVRNWTVEPVVPHTITLNANGGVLVDSDSKIVGKVAGWLPYAVWASADMEFGGWYTEAEGGSEITPTTPIDSDITVYAHWVQTEPEWDYDVLEEDGDGRPLSLVIYGYSVDFAGGLVIPSSIEVEYDDGMISIPVRRIDEYSFEEWAFTSVTIPASVTNIGENAFAWCHNLTNVLFEGGMDSIDMNVFDAFCNTPWLETYIATLPKPDNDDFVDAIAIGGEAGSVSGANIGAGVEDGEPLPLEFESTATVWWKWTAPKSGICVFDTLGSDFDTVLGVYVGSAVDELDIVADNDDHDVGSTSRVEFEVAAGKTYYIAVGGYENCIGNIVLSWHCNEGAIPDLEDDSPLSVTNAIEKAGFADAAVKEVIGGSAEEYNAFKTWAGSVKGATGDALAGEAAVVANAHSAAAYLLGAERLFENEPTVEIDELAVADGESAGTTAMTVAVTVKDGESTVAVDADKVAAMFEATGDLGDWTGAAKLTPTVKTSGTDASGKMTFVVTPGDGTANRAFLRIKR